MTFVRPRARILEISTTSGSGPLALAGAADNSYNRFSAFMSVGDTTYATVVEPGVAFWTGIVTYSASNQITLTTVEENKGTFGAGTKEIMSGALASTSMFREDIAGAIVATGSGSYNVASHRGYATLAELHGNIIAFTPNFTSGAGQLLGVDSLAPKPIRAVPGVDLVPGVLIQGTPYLVLYNNTDGAFYLHGMSDLSANPYGVPIGGSMDYWGAATPSSAFALMFGQPLSRTVYSALFALFGTVYGAGDGTTTFNIPDLRGRVVAGKDDMGGSAASRLSGTTITTGGATTLGGSGGLETHSLSVAQHATLTSTGTITVYHGGDNTHKVAATVGSDFVLASAGSGPNTNYVNAPTGNVVSAATLSGTNSLTTSGTGGVTGGAHNNTQPTLIANKLLRII